MYIIDEYDFDIKSEILQSNPNLSGFLFVEPKKEGQKSCHRVYMETYLLIYLFFIYSYLH